MDSSSVLAVSHPSLHYPSINLLSSKLRNPLKTLQIKSTKIPSISSSSSSSLPSYCPLDVLHKSLPLAASAIILLSSHPAEAGFLSGFPGIESVPGPDLPQIDFFSIASMKPKRNSRQVLNTRGRKGRRRLLGGGNVSGSKREF